MCGETASSDCGPDSLNESAGWSGTCAVAFVDRKLHCSNWPHFIQLLNATIKAVRDASPATKVMVHIADCECGSAVLLGDSRPSVGGEGLYSPD